MVAAKNIAGKRFNKLTAIRFEYNRREPSGKSCQYWLFRCDCGKEKIIKKHCVVSGGTKSCGCIQKEKDITGQKFNSLTAIKFDHKSKKGDYYWLFRCDCGREKIIRKGDVTSGYVCSCGCVSKIRTSKESLYTKWSTMKARCFRKNATNYNIYGGRGIKVCDTWKKDFMSFYNWAINNGYKEGLTLDRIDVNGNYCPENCRWVTMKEQSRNKRDNRLITYRGDTMCVSAMAEKYKVPVGSTFKKLNKGVPLDLIFNN